jgi:hypothetical protein
MISADSGLVDFISSFLYNSTSYSGSDRVGQSHWQIPMNNIADFVAVPAIENRVRELLAGENAHRFTERQIFALRIFIDTVDGKIKRR